MTNSTAQSKEGGGGPSGPTVIKGSEDQYTLESHELSTEKGASEGVSGFASKSSKAPTKSSIDQSRENG